MFELLNVRAIGSQRIFKHNELSIRILLPDAVQQTLARIAFTIIFGVTVAACDRLKILWQRTLVFRMHDLGRSGSRDAGNLCENGFTE